jgi:hypothetical protein
MIKVNELTRNLVYISLGSLGVLEARVRNFGKSSSSQLLHCGG